MRILHFALLLCSMVLTGCLSKEEQEAIDVREAQTAAAFKAASSACASFHSTGKSLSSLSEHGFFGNSQEMAWTDKAGEKQIDKFHYPVEVTQKEPNCSIRTRANLGEAREKLATLASEFLAQGFVPQKTTEGRLTGLFIKDGRAVEISGSALVPSGSGRKPYHTASFSTVRVN